MCGGWAEQIEDAIVWMSAGGTQSVLHSDGMENINCLLDGGKQLVMMDKREKQLVEAEGWSDDGTYSHVDVNAVDLHRFPSLGRVPWWSANMEAGDCLYIPPRWYHAVKSSGPRNLAANLWFVPLLFFNTSDCARWKEPLQDYAPLSNYRFLVADRVKYITAMFRVDLFEGCRDFEKITFDDLLEAQKRNQELKSTDVMKLMEGMDANGDQSLTWSEIFAVDLPALLLEIRPSLDNGSFVGGLLEELRELVTARSVPRRVAMDRSFRPPQEGTPQRPMPPEVQKMMREGDAKKLAELLKDEAKNEDEIKKLVGDVFQAPRDEL
ncbi:hypothetical protein NP493_1302g00064 [Ridgeia piscesae]|uniref:JmjC domain-containing protein n=1 Tax=Ridgeia piscesae TaxID=27915 RepID=A0AAD9K9A9_RIDPI|nr:hypothetical protein NP493_1302g00064 [Ridgeia piscesae]